MNGLGAGLLHAIAKAAKITGFGFLPQAGTLPGWEGSLCNVISLGQNWAREITALGHDVRLMPSQYVKPYVKRQKNDAADAAAICEAVERPNMRFVPVKSRDQQAVLMLQRSRDLLIRQRTMLINALRAHLAELGIIAAQGRTGLAELLRIVEGNDAHFSWLEQETLSHFAGQIRDTAARVSALEKEIIACHRGNPSKRRASIHGTG